MTVTARGADPSAFAVLREHVDGVAHRRAARISDSCVLIGLVVPGGRVGAVTEEAKRRR